jgi:2-(1,2-epoxy-1,2-dihydrophenyl)acetyl-CoA isomerase
MSAPHVLAEVKDGIGWITLNRPESLNALSMEMRDLLIEHSAKFEKDPAVRCVVIRGAGTHFMAGGDIRGFQKSLTEDKEAHLAGFEMRVVKAHQAIYQIRRMNKPVLASVQGAAAGFGLSLIHRVRRFVLHPGLPPYRPQRRRRRDLLSAACRGRAEGAGDRPAGRALLGAGG